MSPLFALAVFSLPGLSEAYPLYRWYGQERQPARSHPRPAHVPPLTVRRCRGSYYVEAKAGTSGQVVNLQLHNDAGTTILVSCRNALWDALCNCTRSAFNTSLSSTLSETNGRARCSKAGANGDNYAFLERVELWSLAIANLSMTLASECTTHSSFLSLGHTGASKSSGVNLFTILVGKGLIATETFSYGCLDGDDTDSRSLIFGALDKNKDPGSLKILDLACTEWSAHKPIVSLSHVKASSQTGDKILSSYEDKPHPIVLDLGVNISTFPQHIAEAIWNEAGAEYLGQRGYAAVPCALAETDNTFIYGFDGANGPQIKMPLCTMTKAQKTHGLHLKNTDGVPLCVFSVLNSTNSSSHTLERDFLRNAYLVFGIHHGKMAFAQGRSDSDVLKNSDMVLFEEYGAPIPSAQSVLQKRKAVPETEITTTLTSIISNSYLPPFEMGAVTHTDSIMGRDDGGDSDARGKDDAFNLSGDLGTWLSIVLVTLVGLAVAYTVHYQRKHRKPHTGIKPPGASEPTFQESDIDLGAARPTCSMLKSQTQPCLQETRDAAQQHEIVPTSACMSPALPVVNQENEEEPKSPTFPSEAKLKSQMPEEKVLGTWSDFRRTYL